LVLLDIKNTPHQNDIFLYTSLLNAISDLINSQLIYISSDFKTDFYFRLGNKNPFRLTRNYSTTIKKNT
jgi:Na+/pantothenate symporter